MTDSVHNLSDEMSLVFLYLAFVLSQGISRNLLRFANLFNSVGLIAVSAVLLWQAIERVLHPLPVQGAIPIIIGLAAAAANWGVARLLLEQSRNNPAIRLAYIHNRRRCMGVTCARHRRLAPERYRFPIFDPLIAGAIALWIIVTTAREIFESHDELIWPEKIVCGHSDHDDAAAAAN